MTRERIERYVEAGRANSVTAIAITEHLFRFREAFDLLSGWWDRDPDPTLARLTHEYWRDHVSGTMAEYVRVVEEAKSFGLPVLLGIEMDWVPDRTDDLHKLLAPYDWDVVLGSVHWIGSWGFDQIERAEQRAEWERRDTDTVFDDYAALLRDLAASGLCDVLAHPDLPKIFGHRPSSFTPLHYAIVESARSAPCAIEINSNGYNKPAAEPYPALPVLERACEAGLAITLASDAHQPERVGARFDDLAALAGRAGYQEFVSFERRTPIAHALPMAKGVR
ncbi:MAG: PHP domain-containing protein [Dehalococcoidia bacterium]